MGARILVVEDHSRNMDMMRFLLKSFGHASMGAVDGGQALELARRELPDLIVCDINLPGLDGYGVVKALKEDPATRHIVVLAVTALAMVGDREKLLDAGFDGYIGKPIEPESFLVQLDAFLAPSLRGARVAPRTQPAPAAPPVPAQGKLLILCDSPSNRDLIRAALEPMGYTPSILTRIEQLGPSLDEGAVDVLVCDLYLDAGASDALLASLLDEARLAASRIVFVHALPARAPASAGARLCQLARPLSGAALRAAVSAGGAAAAPVQPCVLVVDDHIMNRKMLLSLLAHEDLRLLEAADGKLALAMVQAEHPDLVISDILMPEMDGFEFVQRMRADPACAATPVIFYTATYSQREAKVLASACGVQHVLAKPAEPVLILQTVRQALGLPAERPLPLLLDLAGPEKGARAPAPDPLADYLRDLDTTGKLLAQIAARGQALIAAHDGIDGAARRLAQAHDDLQAVGLRLSAIIELGINLASERDPASLVRSACRAMQSICTAKYAVIGVLDEAGEQLLHFYCRGLDEASVARMGQAPARGGILDTLLGGRAAHLRNDLAGDPAALGLGPDHPDLHSFLGVPIASSKHIYGWAYVADKLGAAGFDDGEMQAAMTVAAQLAVAYENLCLYADVLHHHGALAREIDERRRVSEQLAESHQRFEQLANNIKEVFFLIDPATNRIIYISPAYETVWGRSCAALYADPSECLQAIHPEDLPSILEQERGRTRAGARWEAGATFDYRFRIVRPDGSVRAIHARGYPVCDADGATYRIAGIAADVSVELQLQATLRASEAGLQRAQQVAQMGHVITGAQGVFLDFSSSLATLLGLAPAAMPPTIRDWLGIVLPADRALFRQACIDAGKSGARHEVDYRIVRGDGRVIQVHQVLDPLDGAGQLAGQWFNTIQDVTAQKEQELHIERLGRLYEVLSGINSLIVRVHDRDHLLLEACRIVVNQGKFGMAWVGTLDPQSGDGKVLGWYGGAADYNATISFSIHPGRADSLRPASRALRERRCVICNDISAATELGPLREQLLAQGHRSGAALPLIVGGRAVAVLALFSAEIDFFQQEGQLKLLDEMAGDLSFGLDFIEKEERINYLAYFDALTGLANASLFADRLGQMLHSVAGEHGQAAVCVIDLVHFAHLNDVFGRNTGDAVLKLLAERLQALSHARSTVARIGGDVFALAFGAVGEAMAAATLFEAHIGQALSAPFETAQHSLHVAVRAGIALFPADGANAETLFKHAELALKKAKAAGEALMFYAPQMNSAVAACVALESALKAALALGQFEMYYQPRVDLFSGRMASAEALIRWHHPERGMVSPVEFIPLAEATGLIIPIGAWIIDAVCAQQAHWLAEQIDIVPVAINLSAVQFKKGKIEQTIEQTVARHGLQQHFIEFELTESVVMDDPESATHHLQQLKHLGARLSLDDFGTGYSSLAYLKRFPFDFVKIDRAFITDITSDPDDAVIATAVIAMAHSLGLRVVAEGVETEGQLRFLRQHRCDEMQGFYFSKPVPAPEFAAMLRADQRLALAPEPAQREDTLLIVDDEANNLSALRRLLRHEGYRVLTASSGAQGLELLALNPVQVILCDQRMPGMSGSAFLGLVKDLYPDTLRIILSGYTDLAAVTESVNQGAVFKFLTKPWDDADLREHLRDAFRRYRRVP